MNFSFNFAKNGGAMKLEETSLTIGRYTSLCSSHNTATDYGGGIYYEDVVTANQCKFKNNNHMNIYKLPHCFLDFEYRNLNVLLSIHSYKDTAGKGGSFMYGGLLDRCKLKKLDVSDFGPPLIGIFFKQTI